MSTIAETSLGHARVATHLVRGLVVFRGLAPEEVTLVCERLDVAIHGPGVDLFSEDDPRSDAMLIVLSGAVELARRGRPCGRLGPGSVVCETNLLVPSPHTLRARTVGATVVASLRRAVFCELGTDHPRVAVVVGWNLARLLADRLDKRNRAFVKHAAAKALPASSPGNGARLPDLDRFRQQLTYEWQVD